MFTKQLHGKPFFLSFLESQCLIWFWFCEVQLQPERARLHVLSFSFSFSFFLALYAYEDACRKRQKQALKYWSLGLAVTREVSDLFSPGWCQILRLERATRGGALFLWTHFLGSGKQNVRHCCQTTNHGVIRQFVFAFCFSPKSAHTYLCSPGWTAGDLLENSFLFLEGGIIKVTLNFTELRNRVCFCFGKPFPLWRFLQFGS